MKRLFSILFSTRTPRADAVERRIAIASAKNERAKNGLLNTIKELLEENDRITGRPAHARKPRS
jgi:hypothetical protein